VSATDGPQIGTVEAADLDHLLARARELAGRGSRTMLGITGSPGAGKSTLATLVANALEELAVVVPMDGFHLAHHQLESQDLVSTKGAIDTFDVGGFVHLLMRLKAADEPVVYAPMFRRDLEEPIAGAIAVPSGVPLVIVEGNYLLVDGGGWERVRSLLDDVWFLAPEETARMARLIERHMNYGRDRDAARERSTGSDQLNANLIASTRPRADLVVTDGTQPSSLRSNLERRP
jgi:pantothenate kinase